MTVEITPLTSANAAECVDMTFPTYRHLLSLEPAPRHPDQGDRRVIEPLGLVARRSGTPVGLVIGELPKDDKLPEMLSLFVRADDRNGGVASALVGALEETVRGRGFGQLQAVYMTGKPGIPAFERVLEKRSWTPPEARTVTLRFTPEEAMSTPWFKRVRLGAEYELFPWVELRPEEREELKASQERAPWIMPALEPWRHDSYGFDAVSSLGLRYEGRVVGWVINHRIAPDMVRFTCSFMKRGLGRRGRIMPLYTASLERLRATGCRECTFVTPVSYPNMVEFVRTRCAPWATFFGETRGSSKRLAPAAAAGAA